MLDCIDLKVNGGKLMRALASTDALKDYDKVSCYGLRLSFEKNQNEFSITFNEFKNDSFYFNIKIYNIANKDEINVILNKKDFEIKLDANTFNSHENIMKILLSFVYPFLKKNKTSSIDYGKELMKIAKEIKAYQPSKDNCFSKKEFVEFADSLLSENDLNGTVKYIDGKGKDWTDKLEIELENNDSITIVFEILGFDDDEDNALKATLSINGKIDFVKVGRNLNYQTYISTMNKIFQLAKKGL